MLLLYFYFWIKIQLSLQSEIVVQDIIVTENLLPTYDFKYICEKKAEN